MEAIKTQLNELLENVEGGTACPLRTYIELKDLANVLTATMKKVETLAMDEADKYPERTFDYFGATVSKSSTGARYNWEDDKVYKSLKVDLDMRQEQLKRAVKYDELIIDEETGEQIPKVSMKAPDKNVLRISFKSHV